MGWVGVLPSGGGLGGVWMLVASTVLCHLCLSAGVALCGAVGVAGDASCGVVGAVGVRWCVCGIGVRWGLGVGGRW